MRESIQREFRWFIELRKAPQNKSYIGEIYIETEPESRIPLKGLKLGPHSGVRIKGIDTTLGEILKVLEERGAMSSNPEEERVFNALSTMEGQNDLGEYLYSQIWPNTPLDDIIKRGPSGGEIQTHVTIIACDDHIAKLPWILMTYEGKKLVVHRNIGISVSLRNELREVQLGPKITFLIAAPNFDETKDTGAEEHIKDIKMQLAMGNSFWDLENGFHRVITVETWEEFKSVVKEQKPDIIYYYGHGDEGRLAFPDIPVEGRFGAASIDFAAFFKDMVDIKDRPKVIYVNCCRGHQGGNINLGAMLEDLFPIVVINRTAAYVGEAQNQAVSFFLNLLNRGSSPHEAVIYMHKENISFDAIQWWTPVFYRNYSTFYNHIEKEDGLWIIKDWDLKIDRTKQYSLIRGTVQDLLRDRRRGAASFVWYGERDQGIKQFTHRLEIQLPEDLDLNRNDRQDSMIIRPEWPTIKTEKGFKEAICNAFEVKELRSIPARISGEQRDRFNQGGPFLVIVSHQTIESCNERTSNDLKTYLEVWDEFIIPLLDDGQYILIGISYEDEDLERIGSILQEIFYCSKIQDKDNMAYDANAMLILFNMDSQLLDPFIRLNVRDIVDILKKNFPEWRPERLVKYANLIHNRTGGHYMKTVSALQELRDCFVV